MFIEYLKVGPEQIKSRLSGLGYSVAEAGGFNLIAACPDGPHGFEIPSSMVERSAQPSPEALSDFDPAAYLRLNPDVAQANFDPLYHFLTVGWREGRSYRD